jgi:hypothetical protein
MAILTAQRISAVAAEMLARRLVLPQTVTIVPGDEFAGDNGDTVTIRVPQPSAAREQTSPGSTITYDDVTEIPVALTLKHLYHAKRVTDEELSLELRDFARQILRPQVDAVATGAEDLLAAAMNGLPASGVEFANAASEADTIGILLAVRQELGGADVPAGDRFLAVSPSIATRLLSVDKFTDVNRSGMPQALSEATLGRLYGFTVVESNGLTDDTAVAYHRSGFAMSNRVPTRPSGATDSAVARDASGTIGVRHIRQYVPDRLADASVVSTFAGATAVADNATPTTAAHFPRAVRITVAAA